MTDYCSKLNVHKEIVRIIQINRAERNAGALYDEQIHLRPSSYINIDQYTKSSSNMIKNTIKLFTIFVLNVQYMC